MARPSAVPVSISAHPPGTLCRTAFSTRFATRLSTSRGSPSAGARPSLASISTSRITVATMSATSKGSARSMPRSLLASVSSASISFSCCSPSASTSSQAFRSVPASASGSASATCSTVRSAVSGVRSSCEALATKCRCAWKDPSSRPNRSFRVSPSRVNSSSRGPRRSRRLRLLAEMSRAVAVITRTGRSRRPATSQPNATDSTTSTARLTATLVACPRARANGCETTGGAVEPTCTVARVEKNATASTTRPDTVNAPAYNSANRVRSVPNAITSSRSGTRPHGWSR